MADGKTSRGGKKKGQSVKLYQSVSLDRDEAKWASAVADDQGIRVSDLLSPVIRRWLWDKYAELMDRKAKEAKAGPPPRHQ